MVRNSGGRRPCPRTYCDKFVVENKVLINLATEVQVESFAHKWPVHMRECLAPIIQKEK